MDPVQALRKTKIICTIGPASDDPEVLRNLVEAGMNVARLNFSHGNHAEQKARADQIKAIRKELNVPLALMMDTKGPEVRTGIFEGDRVNLEKDQEVRIVYEDILGTADKFSVTYKDLARDVQPGSTLLINDGLINLEVLRIEDLDVVCRVVIGGEIANHKSINLPGVNLQLPALTDKDLDDLRFAVENEFDWIAASFVRRPDDIMEMRRALASFGDKDIKICAKIENREGVDNFEKILKVTDGVMVARGDLGVEIPAEEVPVIQKHMIKAAYEAGLPSITATEMLDSMIRNTRPTRAEVSDVANAIFDGTSCVMLSGETAMGQYPVQAVKMMDRIARYTEARIPYWEHFRKDPYQASNLTGAIGHAACTTAMDIGAKAIITVTHSGNTARALSRFRGNVPIIAATVTERTKNQLAVSWGVTPVVIPVIQDTDELFNTALEAALQTQLVKEGDLVVVTGGTPAGMSGTTNTLRVETLGQTITQGRVASSGGMKQISGDAVILSNHQIPSSVQEVRSYILVADKTTNEDLPFIREARALVIEDPDPESHAVTCAKLLEIPIIYGASNASRLIHNGQMLNLDLSEGTVS
ncbi:MAG: pyruvate kinase [Eubacteriales bacterium]|nr:pyruvate kinase [Clostridiales bacterium]MDY5836545.1 pyruvate kinase [Eubacteriales bacterium]